MRKLFLITTLALSCLRSAAQTVPDYVPTSRLAAWYSFHGSAADSGVYRNDGTITGARLVPNRFGTPNSAYRFNGAGDFIRIPSSTSLILPQEITLLAWIKCDNYNTTISQIFWRGDLSYAHDPYMLFIEGGLVKFRRDVNVGLTLNQISFPVSLIDTSKYHMIVGTYGMSDDTMRLYLDAVQMAAAYLPGTIDYPTPAFWNMIGSVDNGTLQYFPGVIDDVGAWDRRLAQCEISKLFYATNTLITAGPLHCVAPPGTTAHFSISDTGGVAPYQWQENTGTGFVNMSNTGPYTGVTTKNLNIFPVTSAMCGNQYRCVRNAGVCYDISEPATLFCSTTSLTGAVGKTILNISPNPSNGIVRIAGVITTNGNEQVNIQVCSALGQVVYHNAVEVSNGIVDEQIKLDEHLPNGNYYVRIQSETDFKTLQFVLSK